MPRDLDSTLRQNIMLSSISILWHGLCNATPVRQIAGAFSQLEKARLVDKLKKGRAKKRILNDGRCEGRKRIVDREPRACIRAKEIASATDSNLSLREIGRRLAEEGMLSATLRPYTAKVVKKMLSSNTEVVTTPHKN